MYLIISIKFVHRFNSIVTFCATSEAVAHHKWIEIGEYTKQSKSLKYFFINFLFHVFEYLHLHFVIVYPVICKWNILFSKRFLLKGKYNFCNFSHFFNASYQRRNMKYKILTRVLCIFPELVDLNDFHLMMIIVVLNKYWPSVV